MKAKKIIYEDYSTFGKEIRILLGIILEENENYILFKTGAGREYRINQTSVLSIKDTDKEYQEK